MARSEFVKALLRSHREGDDQRFRSTAEKIIQEERRKSHDLLANELEAILEEPVRTRRSGVVSSLRPLPQGRDETPLLRILNPSRSLHDLVLDPGLRGVIEGIVEEQRMRAAMHAHGIAPRSSALFVGPSGTGKSATAEAIAGELGWPIAHVQLATVVSSYLGETAKNLEQIFDFLQSGSWILLFDEFDMLARDRSERSDHGELKRVVAALLQLIEQSDTDSLVVATTNHADLLDAALWRRFDEVLAFGIPDAAQRASILRMKLRGVRHSVNVDALTLDLDGYTHADVETVAHDAMRIMVRQMDRDLNASHLSYAVGRMEERRRTIATSQG